MEKLLFAQITKVNEISGEFWAVAGCEVPDHVGEVFDYESSKPFIKAWSDDIYVNSGGKSRGNLRAMHNAKLAVGIIPEIIFNDAAKTVEVKGQVVDPVELEKLSKGVYTGVSWGGAYARKWRDGNTVRYAAKPFEISLADNPASPGTRLTLVKANGSEVEVEFAKAAVPSGLRKDLWGVSRLAELLEQLKWLQACTEDEARLEADGSSIPDDLKAAVQNLAAILQNYVKEEVAELTTENKMALARGAGLRAGDPLAKAQGNKMQQIHDHAVSLGAACGGAMKNTEAEGLAKVAALETDLKAKDEALAKVKEDLEAKDAELAKVAGEKADLEKRVKELEAQPANPKGALKAVGKGDDVLAPEAEGPTEAEMIKNKDTVGLIKAAHGNPQRLRI